MGAPRRIGMCVNKMIRKKVSACKAGEGPNKRREAKCGSLGWAPTAGARTANRQEKMVLWEPYSEMRSRCRWRQANGQRWAPLKIKMYGKRLLEEELAENCRDGWRGINKEQNGRREEKERKCITHSP